MRTILILAILFVLVSVQIGVACSFDTDCYPGSVCLKSSGSIYGACVGGIRPGNSHDRQPVYAPTDPNRSYGNTCQLDYQCGPGSVCVKGSGIYGTCM
ncbi:MAG: hypothetical protein HQL06_07980 [Nitrospirae bacterium]|nr:hypothetical protein [Nitrospirota bacterium]